VRYQWYLPHHGVYKKSATEKKLRVVFDAAAKYNGKSLNDALLPGPTLQNELPHVLTKFREEDIGFGADIEATFSRIRLQEEDARYHRFLWREKDSDKVDTYQMNRLAFGDTSSPCEAIYITRRTAAEFGIGKEEVVKAIEENLYVDDYLDSAESTKEAIHRGKQVKNVLAEGDLHLRKWISNSPEVTAALGNDQADSEPEGNVANLANHYPETKILRVKWNTPSDELTFSVTPIEDVTYTRRGLLSKLAGLFDPLGFCSPYTIKAKILTQQLCLLGLDWDDPIPPSQLSKWKDWLSKLPELEKIKIPLLTRCSTLWKAQRVMAQVQRFIALCKGTKPASGVMTVEELRVAMVALVRQCQREAFSNEFESLEKNKCVDRRSKLLSFTPYLDKCKREGAKAGHQLLSELPTERMTPMQPAFYHASVDYFGPITVQLTRNTIAICNCPPCLQKLKDLSILDRLRM
jgi:hypothetical protein